MVEFPHWSSFFITRKIDHSKFTEVKSGKQNTRQNQLQNLIDQRTKALSEEAIQSEGNISDVKLEALERVVRLVEIQKAASSPPPPVRWPIVILLAVTLIIVSLLLFARVSSTEIELDLSLSELSFRLPEHQALTEDMRLSSLGISGIKEINLPRSENREAQVLQTSDGSASSIRLVPKLKDSQAASVTLAAVILPAGAHVGLMPTEIPSQYRIFIKGAGIDLRAGVQGLIEIGQSGKPSEEVHFLGPKSILLQMDPKNIEIDITPLTGTKGIFTRQLTADSLSLFHVDEHLDAEQTIVRRISTILSGTMYFESLGGKELSLRPGKEIRFKYSQGQIRTLELKEDNIAFAFHGRVKGMTTGGDQNPVSLMPTYLEWLSARHGLSLLWGTTLYLFGLIFGVIRWWRAKS